MFVSLYLLCFFFYKIREQEGGTGSAQKGAVGTSRRGVEVGKGGRRMNMVQIMCTHVCKAKMLPVETIPGVRRGSMGDSSGGGEFKYHIFDTL
jgi:hypothetical protein